MHSLLLLPLLLFLHPTLLLARISGIAVPTSVAPGSTFRILIQTENYIQSVSDVAITFGVAPASSSAPGTFGSYLSDRYLGPDDSNVLYNISHFVTLPDDGTLKRGGRAVFRGALLSLYGAGYSPTLTEYKVRTRVGEVTSGVYVSSLQQ